MTPDKIDDLRAALFSEIQSKTCYGWLPPWLIWHKRVVVTEYEWLPPRVRHFDGVPIRAWMLADGTPKPIALGEHPLLPQAAFAISADRTRVYIATQRSPVSGSWSEYIVVGTASQIRFEPADDEEMQWIR